MVTQEKTCASHCSVSASLSRTWSSGSASRNTAAWSVKGLTFGAPSHRCDKSLHRDRCGTEPYLTGQFCCFQGDLDGKRGLLLEVVESDDPRFQILPDEFQLVANHGDGPHYSLDHGSWNPGSVGIPPGSLSRRASLLCWASVAHPMSHISERSGLMGRTAPTALHRSWLRCHGPSLSNLAHPPPKSWITTGKSTNAGVRVLGWNCFVRGLPSGWLRNCWSGFPGFLEGYSCLGLWAGLVFCTVGAVFGLSAGWGLFSPTLSWPLVAAGMMVSVGLAGGVVAVLAITSSPTLVIFNGVRVQALSLRVGAVA